MLFTGTLTRVDQVPGVGARVAYVEIPALAEGYEVGPCEAVTAIAAGLAVGDRVLVAMVDLDTYVVFGVLPAP